MEKYRKIIISFSFIIILLSGLIQASDYGIYTDDSVNRSFGYYTYNEISSFFHRSSFSTIQPNDCPERPCDYVLKIHVPEHTPLLEFALVIVEKILSPTDRYGIYRLRHQSLFVLFFIGLIVFYRLCLSYFKGWKQSLLAVFILVLSPRIFADAHYNTSDIGALVGFIFASHAFLRYRIKKTLLSLVLSAFITAIAIDIRAPAIFFIPLTIFYLSMDIYNERNDATFFQRTCFLVIYIFTTTALTIFFWPHIWEDPRNIFFILKTTFSFFPFPVQNLYNGLVIGSPDTPVFYNIVWIGITTPLLYIFLFIIGSSKTIYSFAKRNILQVMERRPLEVTMICCFFLPILSAIILRKSFYNGWRHLYFIYPAFIILSVIGFESIKNALGRTNTALLNAYYSLIFLALLSIGINMAMIHPYEYAFFNSLAPKMNDICDGFDKDYFHLSSNQEIQFLLRSNDRIKVAFVGDQDITLSQSDFKKVSFTDIKNADYLIDNDFMRGCHPESFGKVIQSIRVNDVPISYIIQLH